MSWRRVLTMGLVILAAAGMCFLSGLSSGIEEIGTVSVWDGIVQGDPRADEGITRNVSAVLPPPELVAPLPIPKWRLPGMITQPENRVVVYDVVSRQEMIIDLPLEDGLPVQWVDGGPGARSEEDLGEDVTPRNFGSLSRISNPEDYPWCVNVKLFMRWGSSWWVGSGVLIDPLHVLTAGHCVHEGSGGSWADEIIVVPAYENGWAPYGTAEAANLYSWTGWTVDGDFDHDMGLIKLDRPVGSLTGWNGYGYNTTCSFYTDSSRTWHNPGYPAESPYTGEYMYYWYGYFDQCETYGAWFNNLAYGGQSGSGAYYSDGGNRYVHLVLSAGTSTKTWDVRITSTRFGHIRDDWIGGNTPGTFDLIPLDVQVNPGTINCGSQLSSMNYVVHNYSSASWSGTVTVKVYLSTNDNISTSDTLIQTHYFSYSFGPKSSVRVNVTTPPTIPSGLSSGTYWIGVILDISDYNTGNNDSDGQDAAQISVSCQHTVSTPTTPSGPSTGCAGSSLTYTTGGSTCSQGHSVQYRFDWGDGTYSSWSSSTSASKSWSAAGTYNVKAQARCASDTSVVSSWSSAKSVTTYVLPSTPTGVSATKGTYEDRVRVTWNAVSGATKYEIYRSTEECGTYTKIGESATTSYDNTGVTALQVYWYKVKAYNPCGYSDLSSASYGYAGTPGGGTGAKFRLERETGNVLTDGSYYGSCYYSGAADIAEWVPVSEVVEPGDVLELDPTRPGYYRKARGPCSQLVAGVVSTEPGVVLGSGDVLSTTFDVLRDGQALLALLGVVPVKVTDEGGPIQPGDLLVPSSTPGYAMRWDPEEGVPCGLVGKALEDHGGGTGMIMVLLMR